MGSIWDALGAKRRPGVWNIENMGEVEGEGVKEARVLQMMQVLWVVVMCGISSFAVGSLGVVLNMGKM